MTAVIIQLALAVVPAVLAITLHEAAHGYAALALGDDTARRAGRLSLNPLRHVDRVGTILLPGFLLISQLLLAGRVFFMFGWAKPVPVSAWKFKDPRRGMALVAAAGPAMNFFLAWIGALLMPLPETPLTPGFDTLDVAIAQHPLVAAFLFYFMLSNLVLGLFNLVPIPPLDGGRIAVGLLPLDLARGWARLERAGILLVILLVFLLPRLLREFGIDFDPFGETLEAVVPWAFRLLFRLAGRDIGVGIEHV
ncbi:MAG: site-2 protease family protein [Acetobacteraceae bacterium]|nr:site-2 protease family protein [Acetobacteraceae bacterium]